MFFFFFSSRRRHTRFSRDWSSDVCSSDLGYFRKAIRLALARSANVAKVSVSFEGRSVAAQEITITPYVDDPLKDRIGRYASKIYVFTLSADVPGGIYGIRTVVPGPAAAAKAAPLIEERMRFVRLVR